jgi:hypothetical protein
MVFDQLNAIYKANLHRDFPFNSFRPTPMIASNLKFYFSVVSASANNEAFPNELRQFVSLQLNETDMRYTEAEFRSVMQQMYGVAPEDPDLDRVGILTGCMPLEVSTVFEAGGSVGMPLKERLQQYEHVRQAEMSSAHVKFRDAHTGRLNAVDTHIAEMALEATLSEQPDPMGLDRQLMFWNASTESTRSSA